MTPLRFAIEPEAISESWPGAGVSLGVSKALLAAHCRLIDFWRVHGVLILDRKPTGGSALLDRISKVRPPDTRSRWEKVFDRAYYEAGNDDFWSLRGLHLRIVRPSSLDTSRRDDGSPDAMRCTIADFDRESVVRKLSRAVVLHDKRRTEEVWRRYFAERIRRARHIVVVDRYALREFCEKDHRHQGLTRLIEAASASAVLKSLTILSSSKPAKHEAEVDIQLARRRLSGLWKPSGKSELRLYTSGYREFVTYGHDRHTRFDDVVVMLGRGLGVLDGERVGGSHTLAIFDQHEEEGWLDRERALMARAKREVFSPVA